MTTLDEERLFELRRLVPPVLSPPIRDVHERAARLQRSRNTRRLVGGVGLASVVVVALALAVGGWGRPGHGSSPTGASPDGTPGPLLRDISDDRAAPRMGAGRVHTSGPGDRSRDRVPR